MKNPILRIRNPLVELLFVPVDMQNPVVFMFNSFAVLIPGCQKNLTWYYFLASVFPAGDSLNSKAALRGMKNCVT